MAAAVGVGPRAYPTGLSTRGGQPQGVAPTAMDGNTILHAMQQKTAFQSHAMQQKTAFQSEKRF